MYIKKIKKIFLNIVENITLTLKVTSDFDNLPEEGGVDLLKFETMSPKLDEEFAPDLL